MFNNVFKLFSSGPPVPVIDAQELHRQMKAREKPYLVDVRSRGEFKAGHIAGAKLIPLDVLTEEAARLPKDRTIVCVCRSGRRSKKACQQLAQLGYSDVVNLTGGVMAWQRAHLPLRRR